MNPPLTPPQQELLEWLESYIQEHQTCPSYREMTVAMGLRSAAPVQQRLAQLRDKGYVTWKQGCARSLRVLKPSKPKGIPIVGAIAAGEVVTPFADVVEHLDLAGIALQSGCFALQVRGDSMIGAMINNGDVVIMRPVPDPQILRNGAIVAALVQGEGTTLKYFHRDGKQVVLKPANPRYEPIRVLASEVTLQGVLIGVWRGLA